ncbi:M81 family metallopeptidase [Mesorhizobium muleiense]|uniref:M81 family metallopeptidase n=1 Tax=Mesorhizobium muleiense TaxID=1004279 RepID=UPI001F3A3D97|nr:M81 family metallopeptidase [Mesorhizobium muleiense]MCF6108928.1 M81 family metallopeptidase [Mesorhizobium muleiense]
MKKSAPRILVARIWHESNGFNPQPTSAADFQISEGDELLTAAATSGSTLAGIIQQLSKEQVDILPSLSVVAPPSGLVDHAFFLKVKERLISDAIALKPDAIALELHGAMGTTLVEDAEGDLLAGLRAAVGEKVPIGVGLDLHAHVTDAMLAAVDICIACKENPHSDVIECGEKVAAYLLAMLNGSLRPVTAMAKIPMILPGAAETATGPLREIHDQARVATKECPAIWDVSLFNVFRYADDEDIGQAAVVLTNDAGSKGELVAETLARAFWEKRARFADDLLSIDEALDTVAAANSHRPFVLADMGDRVLAGAPGDSTAILEASLRRRDGLRGAIPITDPHAVDIAFEAGVGNIVSCAVGGRITPGFGSLPITGKVIHLSSGDFTLAGPFQGGEPSSMGRTAVVEIDNRLLIVLTAKAAFSHDPAVFTSQGIELASRDFFVVKSGYHFKLNFGAAATPLLVRTPGVGYYTKGSLCYRKARFWPEHDTVAPAVNVRIFDRAAS